MISKDLIGWGLGEMLFLHQDRLFLGGADAAYLPDVDFNGTPREGSLDAGAYRFDPDGNPSWSVSEGFKQFPADFNRDFIVDGLDLDIFQAAFALGTEGDADGDGDTDGADFLTWQRRTFGAALPATTLATTSTGVPEPNSLLLILLGTFLASMPSRRRR